MPLFRRGPEPPKDFWTWWATARDRVAEAINGRAMDPRLIDEITSAVNLINPQMAWELAPGRTAQHAFCISPEGRADLRQIALRWLEEAPPADQTWEFYASRRASPSLVRLDIGGSSFELSEMRSITSWNSSGRRIDVRLWHPHFEGIPPPVRVQVAFLFLDNLLGEDEVERWIGRIDTLDAPIGGRSPDELLAEIHRHRADPESDDSWVLGELDRPDGRTIVLANTALKRIDHPFSDKHITINVVFEDRGFPNDSEAARLNAEEDDLVQRFKGVAVYAGRTTKPGLRTMHFVAQDLERVRSVIDAWAEELPPCKIKVGFTHDMNWVFRGRDLGIG